LQHLIEQDAVEGAVCEGQRLTDADCQPIDAPRSPDRATRVVDVHAVRARREVAEAPDVGAKAATDVEHSRVFQRDVATKHLQPPLLPEAPHIARVTENDLVQAVRIGRWGVRQARVPATANIVASAAFVATLKLARWRTQKHWQPS